MSATELINVRTHFTYLLAANVFDESPTVINPSVIYAYDLTQFETNQLNSVLTVRNGPIRHFETNDSRLMVATTTSCVEIYYGPNINFTHQIRFREHINRMLLQNETIIVGTDSGCLLSFPLWREDRVCMQCEIFFVKTGCRNTICEHYTPLYHS